MATIICPSCGGENNVTKKSGQECAYCGTHLSAPQKTTPKAKAKEISEELPLSQQIILIDSSLSSKEEVEKALRAWLVNVDNIPLDIFDHLTIEEVKWYYLPMLRFSGNIETEWSCNQIIEKKREIAEKPVRDRNGNIIRWEKEFEYYNEYIPKSGRGRGPLDMLVPCGITTGLPDELNSCYVSIDYSRLKHDRLEDYSNKTKPVPSNAAVCTQFLDFGDDKVLSPVAETGRYIAQACSFGSLLSTERCDEHLSFSQNFHYPTGCLYFVPFVYVVYSYRGDSFEWCFMQDPKVRLEASIIPEMDEGENPMLTMQEEFRKEQKEISKRDLISVVVSFFIPPMFGALFYFLYTHSRTEIAKRRLNEQQGLVSLLFKLKRQENLRKHGYDAELKHDNEYYNFHIDENKAADEDYIRGGLPTTVEGIQSYFAQTELLRKKALKRIRGYWFWFIGIILIIASSIIGYSMYGNYVQEKAWEEEQAILEEEMASIRQEWQNKFQEEFVGKEMLGTDITSHPTRQIQIKFIDDSTLQYSIAEEDWLNMDFSNPSSRYKTISTKTVPYTIEVSRHRNDNYGYGDEFDVSVKLEFDNYVANDLLGESLYHRNDDFANEFNLKDKYKKDSVLDFGFTVKRK